MRLIGLLIVLAAIGLWSWSSATARPMRFDGAHSLEFHSRCPIGYRKSTITARCVKSGNRFSWF